MIRKVIVLFCLLISSTSWAQNIDADELCGIWLTGSGKAHVKIYRTTNNTYCGKIIWLKEPLNNKGLPKVDEHNPSNTLKNLPLMGAVVFSSFTYEGSKKWENGTIYDPENGKTYDCIIRKESPDELKIRGYIGISLIGRTDTWKKVK